MAVEACPRLRFVAFHPACLRCIHADEELIAAKSQAAHAQDFTYVITFASCTKLITGENAWLQALGTVSPAPASFAFASPTTLTSPTPPTTLAAPASTTPPSMASLASWAGAQATHIIAACPSALLR